MRQKLAGLLWTNSQQTAAGSLKEDSKSTGAYGSTDTVIALGEPAKKKQQQRKQAIISLLRHCVSLMTYKPNLINTATLTRFLNGYEELQAVLETHLEQDPKFTALKESLDISYKDVTDASFQLNQEKHLGEIKEALETALSSFEASTTNSCS